MWIQQEYNMRPGFTPPNPPIIVGIIILKGCSQILNKAGTPIANTEAVNNFGLEIFNHCIVDTHIFQSVKTDEANNIAPPHRAELFFFYFFQIEI